MRVAFVVEAFPVVSEPFIIDQVAGLIDRGVEVKVFSFRRGGDKEISNKFYEYEMEKITKYIDVPKNKFARLIKAIPKGISLLLKNPKAFFQALNYRAYVKDALSLNLLYWAEAFAGERFDLAHCHFGTAANKYLNIKDALGLPQKIITTFYGYDISRTIVEHGSGVYDKLKKECPLFFVMSRNARERIIKYGFSPEKVVVHPVGINIEEYPFKERIISEEEPVKILSVGRFVEKKGFDDLLMALDVARGKTNKRFNCTVVGDGPMKKEILNIAESLKLSNILDFRGYVSIKDVISLMGDMHFFVQPSKTAKDGNME